jgi:alpha-beta hydrolase superfamily lysophospholipase
MTKSPKFLTTGGVFHRFNFSHSILMRLHATTLLLVLFVFCSACSRAQQNPGKKARIEDHKELMRFASEGDTLEGVLEVPVLALENKKKVTLIVFVHGSGQATRSDYENVAIRLRQSGFATFRYDKRGVGLSGGSFEELGPYNSEARVRLLAADAAAAIKYLRRYSWLDEEKIIVMGGSQAGWIIPVVSSLTAVSASVIISGPTVSVGEEMFYSDFAERGKRTQAEADQLLPNFKGFHGFDNISYVSAMGRPSLWIFGGQDVSIPVKECIRRLDSVKQMNKLPIEIKLYPDGDHGLFNRDKQIREHYMDHVIDWLGKL